MPNTCNICQCDLRLLQARYPSTNASNSRSNQLVRFEPNKSTMTKEGGPLPGRYNMERSFVKADGLPVSIARATPPGAPGLLYQPYRSPIRLRSDHQNPIGIRSDSDRTGPIGSVQSESDGSDRTGPIRVTLESDRSDRTGPIEPIQSEPDQTVSLIGIRFGL